MNEEIKIIGVIAMFLPIIFLLGLVMLGVFIGVIKFMEAAEGLQNERIFIPYDELKLTPLKSSDWGAAGYAPLSYRELQQKLIAEEAKNLRLCRQLRTRRGGTHNTYYTPILQQFDELQDGRNG
jgi:hypothetical protein